METNYQLIVIGAGPGGYVAAIRAAQLGLKTAVIENRQVGGTCLNRGCIPTKSMLHAAELYHEAVHNFETLGLHAENVGFDGQKIQDRKEDVVGKLRGGIEQLFKSDGVAHLRGTGTIVDAHTVRFTALEGEGAVLTAEHILIATGSVPSNPPVEGMELPNVITSDELLDMTRFYDHLIVAGAGVIGMEFASLYNAFGKQVTIMASRDRILPKVDKELAQNLTMVLKKRGVKFVHKARLKRRRASWNAGTKTATPLKTWWATACCWPPGAAPTPRACSARALPWSRMKRAPSWWMKTSAPMWPISTPSAM